jgi:hypothetical protein
MAFLCPYLKRAKSVSLIPPNDGTPVFLQLRNSVVVLINIVIPGDCQYYFCAGAAKNPEPEFVRNLPV